MRAGYAGMGVESLTPNGGRVYKQRHFEISG